MMLLTASFVLSAAALAQSSPVQTLDKQGLPSATEPAAPSALPPSPKGKSTVIGGEIRNVDPVRDQFTLKVFGGHSMKILFDERTQVYRNGVRIPLLDLHPEDHASVETTLDGTKIYALRIHMLSQLPEGESRARVLSYNPKTGALKINVASSEEPVTLRMTPSTSVVHVGQDALSAHQGGASDLVVGSVIDVKFTGGTGGFGTVTHIDVVATPGSTFVFSGKVSSLDLPAGRLVIVDPRDDQTYPIAFEPARFPVSRELHQGQAMKVTTRFDGTRYVASDMAIE